MKNTCLIIYITNNVKLTILFCLLTTNIITAIDDKNILGLQHNIYRSNIE